MQLEEEKARTDDIHMLPYVATKRPDGSHSQSVMPYASTVVTSRIDEPGSFSFGLDASSRSRSRS